MCTEYFCIHMNSDPITTILYVIKNDQNYYSAHALHTLNNSYLYTDRISQRGVLRCMGKRITQKYARCKNILNRVGWSYTVT